MHRANNSERPRQTWKRDLKTKINNMGRTWKELQMAKIEELMRHYVPLGDKRQKKISEKEITSLCYKLT